MQTKKISQKPLRCTRQQGYILMNAFVHRLIAHAHGARAHRKKN
jgi:hypothetical protein